MIRVAAVGDVHFGIDSAGILRPQLEHLPDRADVLLITGDLTRCGSGQEAKVFAEEVRDVPIPTVAVLGNHDYHADQQDEIRDVLEQAGVQVLEREATTLEVKGARIGIAGAKGFGGGFAGASGSDFGEPEMKAFIRHTKAVASAMQEQLEQMADCDVRIALLHYSPIKGTLLGERLEIYPFLGSYLLGEAIDHGGADLVLHGHAHRGTEKGVTPGGVHVRNVAQPVIQHAYNLYCLQAGDGVECEVPLSSTPEGGAEITDR